MYDGHAGAKCANFLRDNLHRLVAEEPAFPANPREAIFRGFARAEKEFLLRAVKDQGANRSRRDIERSGSCALVALVVGDRCYVANVGDSRAVLSS